MTFGSLINDALPRLQAAAEALMVDACTITRLGEWTVDPDTGVDVPPSEETVYSGPCKVQTYEPYESAPDVGGQTVVLQRYSVHVPVSAGRFEVGDVVTITASPHLPASTDRKFRVGGLHEKTWQTSQRLLVDEAP